MIYRFARLYAVGLVALAVTAAAWFVNPELTESFQKTGLYLSLTGFMALIVVLFVLVQWSRG